MKTIKKLLFLLTPKERNRAALLFGLILVMSLIEMIGVASILPFMTVLTNPSLVESNFVLISLFKFSNFFGVEDKQDFVFALGILVFVMLVISLSFKALTTYALVRFVQMREYSIGKRILEGYLKQPYSWFLSRHSADLGKTILSEVQQIILLGMRPLMESFAQLMVITSIILLLFVVDTKLTLTIGIVLSGAYMFVFYLVRNYLNTLGNRRLSNNQLRFTFINEAFSAIKEVKVGGLEKTYINKFSNSAQIFARAQASWVVIAQLPRFILEAIAFGGVLLLILYIIAKTGDFNTALPIVSLYVYAGYRLMPAMQKVYEGLTQLTFIRPSVDKIYNDFKNLNQKNQYDDQNTISFNKKITLKDIDYNYPNSDKNILTKINLTIPSKSTIGFIGVTGSGKTTLVDIILGLLDPKKGTLEVDGKIISNHNSRSWQKLIGYVPQQINLVDDTVAANIAFGLNLKDIDYNRIEKVSKISNLHEFVINELPNQYQTIIGERGIRLSGGQRQRIAIARALYHNPKLLILDEATSALDNQTEKAVMDAINNLEKNMTIILIAHRLNTIKKCDKIFLVNKGEIKKEVTYEELMKDSEILNKKNKLIKKNA